MNLSYWEQQSFYRFDAIVIGSGIVGLTTAYYLKKRRPDWKIAVLEKGFIPAGASTKNAGFACFGSISELIEQEKTVGAQGLHQLIERRWKGLLKLRALLGDDNIDFQNLGGYEVFDGSNPHLTKSCFEKIDHYNQLVKDILPTGSTYSACSNCATDLGFQENVRLIRNKFEGQLDTGKLIYALLKLIGSKGILLLNNCAVHQVETQSNKVKVYSNNGNFECNKLLVATNAFARQLFSQLDVIPGRGQVLITKPISGLKLKGTFHFDKGFYYFRNIHNRILLGGGRNLDFKQEETTAFGLTNLVQNRLEQMLKQLILPGVPFEIESRWSGIMAFGTDLFPIIKEIEPNIYCGVRGSGMGIAMGTQTGHDLAAICNS